MNKSIKFVLAALAAIGTSGVVAAQTVVVSPEQETVIREYVKKKPIASIAVPGVELNIGSPVPETVELHSIDAPDMTYRYVVVDDRTVLVDPGTRKVVRILD